MNDFFNKSLNKLLYERYEDIINFTNVYISTQIKTDEIKKRKTYPLFQFYMIFSCIYIGIKIILTIIRIICYSHGYQQASVSFQKKLIDDDSFSYDKSRSNSLDSSSYNNNNNNKENSIFNYNARPKYAYGAESFPVKIRIIKFFDIIDNIRIITLSKNNFCVDDGIEPLNFIRAIVMIFIVLFQTFYTIFKFPSSGFLNYNFFSSSYFSIIKLSISSSVYWIILDGAVTTYKLMMVIKRDFKRRNSNRISFKIFPKFFMYSLPKIVIYLLILYFFEYFYEYYGVFFNARYPLDEYYSDTFLKEKKCFNKQNFFKIFTIPFMGSKNTPDLDNCFRHASIYISIFYCFIILLIYVYIVNKIRISKFDNIITILFLISGFFISYFVKRDHMPSKKYILDYVLGENMSEKYLIMVFIYYFYGILIGMCFFYYNDVMSGDSMTSDTSVYFPFSLCFYIVKKLDTLSKIVKFILFYLFCFFIVLISFTFYFMSKKYNSIFIDNFSYFQIPFMFEKHYNALCFCCILLLLLVYPKDSFLRNLTSSTFFQVFSRVSYVFYSINEIGIYFIYFFMIIQVNLNYQSLIMLTIENFIFVFVCAVIFSALYELPFKLIVKSLCGNKYIVRQGNNFDSRPSDASDFIKNELELIHQF